MNDIDEMREKIFELVTDPPCRKCEFWDVQEHYCWLRDTHPNSSKCELMNQLLNLKTDTCHISTCKNEPELPENVYEPPLDEAQEVWRDIVDATYKRVLKAGFEQKAKAL